MRRIFCQNINSGFLLKSKFQYYKLKQQLHLQSSTVKNSLFNCKTFPEIINIIKNPQNPYPKNSAYFHALLQSILEESNQNSKIMIDHGDVIHIFLQEIMERIKTMGARELSEILSLLRFRPKALRFDKELLITMHVRFQSRINQLIDLNIKSGNLIPEQQLTMTDLKNQIEGLFYLKKNTMILNKILNFSQKLVQKKKSQPQKYSLKQIEKNSQEFYSIVAVINENLDDTIDPVRENIADFIWENYKNKTLPYNKQILRMIVKCKFYKNYPIVRNQDWLHDYVYNYLNKIVNEHESIDIEEYISVLKNVTTYVMHIDGESFQQFLTVIDRAYMLAKSNLLSICYINDKQQLGREVNTISHQIKLIPSYLYLKNYYQISTTNTQDGNKVNSHYIKLVIDELKPIIKKFVLCYFEKVEQIEENGQQALWLTKSIQENIEILNRIIQNQQQPQKLLLKSVQNLLNTVTVFKDYNIINIDVQFSFLLIETEIIYCILCRKWISDEVRYLRLLQHAVFMICQFDKELTNGNPKVEVYKDRLQRVKDKMKSELTVYDNTDKTYKQFTVLRLVAVLKCLNMKPKYLGDFYRNVKLKKPNIYVETLSRTMLKVYNYDEVIEAFDLIFQGKILVKEIQLGRIVFLSSKESQLLKYWIHRNRKNFISKVCFCRRIINNIVSIIRMDNLEINRNSIQLLSEIVIENKLNEIENHSISNLQESNALKRILCNNFSILFRYSKMDSMIDDIFVVHKNIPTIFRKNFSHIELIKILSFSAYLSEEQSIFYINRQNKNALFKFVIMLMQKNPFCEKKNDHYLFGERYNQQSIIFSVMDKIIQQYWPDNKLTNKGMPFYAEFLNYYTKINEFNHLVENDNTIFLIIKQILQDFKQVQDHGQLKFIINRMEHNYERLNFLSIFQNENNLNSTLENVLSSMNFSMDLKIFGQFVRIVEGWIRDQIQEYNLDNQQVNRKNNKPWKKKSVNKHFINKMIIEELHSMDHLSEYDVLSLMTINILSQGMREVVNKNMELLIKRLIKINPTSAQLNKDIDLTQSKGNKQKFPFELFKVLMSNLNIYLAKRGKRISEGKQSANPQVSIQKITEWLIKCLLTYSNQISNNQQMLHIIKYLNNWNVDVLALIKNKFIDIKINLANLGKSYFDVNILAFIWSQNNQKFIQQNQVHENYEFKTQSLLNYISTILTQFQQSHLMNNYGIYFNTEGEKILNVIQSLLYNIVYHYPQQSDNYKVAEESLIKVKQLIKEFNVVCEKTQKYNKLRIGARQSYLCDENQELIDQNFTKKQQNYLQHINKIHSRNQSHENSSKNTKVISNFTQILQVHSLIKLSKQSVLNASHHHKESIRKINNKISQKQKDLFLKSSLSYFLETQPLILQKNYEEIGLKVFVKKSSQENQLTVFYLVNERQSMLYDFAYKKRRRLTGQEQEVVDYIGGVIKNITEKESNANNLNVQVKILPLSLNKVEIRRLISN